MVILVNNAPISDSPRSLNWLTGQYPSLKAGAKQLVAAEPKQLNGNGALYVGMREFAVTHSQDSSISVVGTDNLINNTAVIIRNSGTGSVLFAHVDRLTTDDLSCMLTKLGVAGGKLELHLIGGFGDTKNVSENLLVPVLNILHRSPHNLDLVTCCVGEVCTVVRGGAPWPLLYGVGVYVKNGIMFPASFMDRGPDMDMRLARTLTGGEGVCMLDIYAPEREELRIGPFSYLPMRSVDIWLTQSDDFILQSLTPCPEVVADREMFVRHVRATLKLVKSHPYPSVTVFHTNTPRVYKMNDVSGHWLPTTSHPATHTTTSTSPAFWSTIPFPAVQCAKPEPQPIFQDDLCLSFKQENTFINPWQFQEPSQVYY